MKKPEYRIIHEKKYFIISQTLHILTTQIAKSSRLNQKKHFYFAMMLCLLFSIRNKAQDIAAFNNTYRQFIIQDQFDQKNAEAMSAFNYKIGRTCIAYNDNSQQFKIYHSGTTYKPTQLIVSSYSISDNLVAYDCAGILSVFDNGDVKKLCSRTNLYQLSDSLLFYSDEINQKIMIYYKGQKKELENFLTNQKVQNYKLGDNILGYVNFANQFKIFYQDQIILQDYNDVMILGAGRDIICYKDINGYLKVFYAGDTYTLDEYATSKIWVGDEMVAFMSSDGNFKLFYQGGIKTIGYFEPKEIGIKDFLLWYTDFNGYFQVFYDGEFTQLDTQYPESITAKYRTMVYRNRFDNLIMYRQGKKINLTTIPVQNMNLYYDIIVYTVGLNSFKVYGAEEYN